MIGGELVREARLRSRMTQQQLADKAGTTQSAIARLESCRTSPSLEDVQRLMRLAGFELIIELAPFDDSDRNQAMDLLWATPDMRIELNRRSVDQADEIRAAFLAAQYG